MSELQETSSSIRLISDQQYTFAISPRSSFLCLLNVSLVSIETAKLCEGEIPCKMSLEDLKMNVDNHCCFRPKRLKISFLLISD